MVISFYLYLPPKPLSYGKIGSQHYYCFYLYNHASL